MSDPTGGWICTVSTLSCSRTTNLAASTTDSVTLTHQRGHVHHAPELLGHDYRDGFERDFLHQPVVQRERDLPAGARHHVGHAREHRLRHAAERGAAQRQFHRGRERLLIRPAAGTILGTGKQTLNTTFTPTDAVDYTTATASVTLTVVPGTPTITITSVGQSDLYDRGGDVHGQPSRLRVFGNRHHDVLCRIDCDWHGYGVGRLGDAHHHFARRPGSNRSPRPTRATPTMDRRPAVRSPRQCRTLRWPSPAATAQ